MNITHIQTLADYVEYVRRVTLWLERNKVKPGCHGPVEPEAMPFFSHMPCACCSRPLGGNRETYSFAVEGGETFAANICTDCVYYLAYGTLDGFTMHGVRKHLTDKARIFKSP